MGAMIRAVRGDITQEDVDAIVNAANERMLGGGGVDGAIHRAAGRELVELCRAVPEVRDGVRCPTGEARLTGGAKLEARFVIHTVGPRYAMPNAPALLTSAFRSSLTLASEHPEIRSVSLPAVSCGVFGYPIAEAAKIAVDVAREREWDLDVIRFVLFSESDLEVFERAIDAG
ncbi:MAG: O-acetyl-ADP-ribose deacetylase [Sandaracinaceae bacterium]